MNQLIVMVSGKQGSGKSTLARALREKWQSEGIPVLQYKFAQPIYEMHDVLYLVASDYGIEPPPGKDKTLLQLLGTEWGRTRRGANIWIRCAQRKIDKMTAEMRAADQFHIIIIDDLRFRNELSDMGPNTVSVRLECDRDVRRQRANGWRDNETHPSEVDLDGMHDKFDCVVETSASQVVDTVERVDEICRKRFPRGLSRVIDETIDSRSAHVVDPSKMRPSCP